MRNLPFNILSTKKIHEKTKELYEHSGHVPNSNILK